MLHRSRSSQSIDLVIYDFPSRTSSTKANWCSWIAPHSSRVRSLSLYRSSLDIPNPRLLETLASCTWPRLTVLQFEAYPLEKPPTTPVDFLLQAVIGTGSPDLKALTIPYLPKTCSLGADLSTLKITSPFENTGELSCVLGRLTRLGSLDIHCDFDIITLPSTIILPATLHTFHASGPDVACATLFQLLRVEESPGPDVFRKLAIYMERTYDLEIMDELVTGLTKFLGVFVPGDEAFTTITYSLVKTAEPNMQALSVRGLGKMAFVALTGYDWAHADEFDFGIDFLSCLTGRRHLGFEFEVDADFTPKHFANSHFRACACFPSKVHWFQLEAPLETFCLSSALWALPQPNSSLLFLG